MVDSPVPNDHARLERKSSQATDIAFHKGVLAGQWIDRGQFSSFFFSTESLDEQDSLASIFLDGTIDLVDSSSWEFSTNPPTSSLCCWNHSQASISDLVTTGEKRCNKRWLILSWEMEHLGCCMNTPMDLRDICVITMKL
ncbi:hypothetical protein GQ457_04G009760 [Hibiscus cannabinus]